MKELEEFQEANDLSIDTIEVDVEEEFGDEDEQQELQDAISASKETLKQLSILHQDDHAEQALDIASNCPKLIELEVKGISASNASGSSREIRLPADWKPKLKIFNFYSEKFDFRCDHTLVQKLEEATLVL